MHTLMFTMRYANVCSRLPCAPFAPSLSRPATYLMCGVRTIMDSTGRNFPTLHLFLFGRGSVPPSPAAASMYLFDFSRSPPHCCHKLSHVITSSKQDKGRRRGWHVVFLIVQHRHKYFSLRHTYTHRGGQVAGGISDRSIDPREVLNDLWSSDDGIGWAQLSSQPWRGFYAGALVYATLPSYPLGARVKTL